MYNLMLGDDLMQKKGQVAPTIVYPESDGEPMAEAEARVENVEAELAKALAEIERLRAEKNA